jgi:hypothetical protein
MITTAHRMESLSRAYLQAVAAQAELNYSLHGYDYGVDITLREVVDVNGRYVDTGMQIDVQLKSTTRAIQVDDGFKIDLDVRTYDDLRSNAIRTLRVLVVLMMPEAETEWLDQSLDALCLRRCAYWVLLRGMPGTDVTTSVRITIPAGNVLTVDALLELVRRPIERTET